MRTLRNFLMIILLGVLLWGCGGRAREVQQVVRKVKIGVVETADSLEQRAFPGLLREAAEVNLAFRVAGPIAHVAVKEGDYVQAGQLIARIDSRDYEIQLQAAEAQYQQVKAEAERVIELHKRQSVPDNDYDKAVSGLRMVEAHLKHARDQLNDTRLLAPAAGYIQKVNFGRNELIDAGMPFAALIDISHYVVEVDIPVSLYIRRSEILSFTGYQPVIGGEPFGLRLLSYSRKANQNQLYRLQLALDPGSRPGLAAGMDIQVNVHYQSQREPQACVPLSALFSESGKTFVWVYEPEQRQVAKRQVHSGRLTGDGRVRIDSGLQPGEQVVTAGVNLLREGEKVLPMEPVSETNVGGLL